MARKYNIVDRVERVNRGCLQRLGADHGEAIAPICFATLISIVFSVLAVPC